MNSKTMKQVQKIAEYSKIAHRIPKTEEDIIERYNEVLMKSGQDQADKAIINTLRGFKQQANEKQKEKLQDIKNDLFNKAGWCPTSLREIKRMLESGELAQYGITD